MPFQLIQGLKVLYEILLQVSLLFFHLEIQFLLLLMLIISKHTLQLFQRLRQIDQSLAKILQTHCCLKEIILAFASSSQNRRLQLLFYPSPILLLQIGYILSEMILQYLHVLQL